MKKPLLIINPKAGKGLYQKNIFLVIEQLAKAGVIPSVYLSQYPGDARRIASEQAADYDAVLCYGGDGTLNEVIAGVLESGAERTIGYLPAGSTNDYAFSLKLPKDMRKLADVLLNGQEQESDVGMFNGRPFVYVAAFGAFTEIPYTTDQTAKNIFGHAAYIMEGAKSLMDLSPVHMTVRTNGQVFEDDFIFGMVSNSESIGGMRDLIAGEEVRLNDGFFEMLLIRNPVSLTDWNEILMRLSSKTYDNRYVYYQKVSEASFSSPSQVSWTLDGEYGGAFAESEIRNMHKAVRILVP